MEQFYTITELSKLLKLNRETIKKYIRSGEIKAIKLEISRRYVIPQSEVDRILSEN